jgi:hypothetical protein
MTFGRTHDGNTGKKKALHTICKGTLIKKENDYRQLQLATPEDARRKNTRQQTNYCPCLIHDFLKEASVEGLPVCGSPL